jgi:WD40 repeat protein
LPATPYRSLNWYDRGDRALFAGREADVLRFARILDEPATRILILHGESGVGKTSFLMAGVIPFLEEECVGYRFARDRAQEEAGPVLLVRATNDLTGQLAQALCTYCARPYSYQSPSGEETTVDLPAILRNTPTPNLLRAALQASPGLLGSLLAALAAQLPFGLVLVIDQGEEVFTLARTPDDAENRRLALEALRQAAATPSNFKLIVSLRTEYHGRLIDRLRRGSQDTSGVREYLLTDFDEAELVEAIRRPTATTPIRHAREVPFEKYHFRYEDGLPREIARRILAFTVHKQDSVLPLAQVICTQLYGRARHRPDGLVTSADLQEIGGIEGGMREHVTSLLTQLFRQRADRTAFQQLLAQLFLRQPDGTLTTALMPEDELERSWRGRADFELLTDFKEMLAEASGGKYRLLRVSTLRLGGEAERRYVSLGHDALAPVAAEWEAEQSRGLRVRRMVALLAAVSGVALIMALLAGAFLSQKQRADVQAHEAQDKERVANEAKNHAEHEAYVTRMNLVPQAWQRGDVPRVAQLLQLKSPLSAGQDQRGFEWYYWKHLSDARPQTLQEHRTTVLAVTFAPPEGRYFASADASGRVIVWETSTRRPVQSWQAGSDMIWALSFSPDGKALATGCLDGSVSVWNPVTGANLFKDDTAKIPIWGIAYRPDGSLLAAATQDGNVELWDAGDHKKRPHLTIPGDHPKPFRWVRSVTFSPVDAGLLAAVTAIGEVHVWDVKDPDRVPHLRTIKLPEGETVGGAPPKVGTLAFHPNGEHLGVGWGNNLELVAIAGNEVTTLRGHQDHVAGVAFAANGDLASASWDRTVKVWLDGKDATVLTYRGHEDSVWSVAFPPDAKNRQFASAGSDGTIRWWDETVRQEPEKLVVYSGHPSGVRDPNEKIVEAARGGTFQSLLDRAGARQQLPEDLWRQKSFCDRGSLLHRHPLPITVVAFDNELRQFAAVTNNRAGAPASDLAVWDVASGHKVRLLKGLSGTIWAVTCSRGGQQVAAGDEQGKIAVWGKTGEAPVMSLQHGKPEIAVSSIAFRADGGQLASAGEDGVIKVWDLASRQAVRTDDLHAGSVWALAFSPNGQWLAAGASDGLWLCDLSGGGWRRCDEHLGRGWCVAFSPDGQRLLFAGDGRSIEVWGVPEGQKLCTYEGHSTAVWTAAFSPDGKRVASAGKDGVVKVWEPSPGMGTELLALPAQNAPVWSLAFNPNGTVLATAGADGAVHFWRAAAREAAEPPR